MNDATIPLPPNLWRDAARGVVQSLPAVPAYVAVSMGFGVLAVDGGMAPWLAIVFSAVVFAGTAQFAALPMIAAGLPPAAIVATAAIVCARFLAFAAALAPYLRHFAWWERLLYGAHLTSTTFALHVTILPLRAVSRAELFAANLTGYTVWVGSAAFGAVLGERAGDLDRFGIDFAMPAMFLAITVTMIRDRCHAVAAAAGGVATVVLVAAGASHLAILIAACAGAAVGWSVFAWTQRRPS
ncbi:MAG: AzlC family ABC transporter permease [Alphaproteobacteria bacterium]